MYIVFYPDAETNECFSILIDFIVNIHIMLYISKKYSRIIIPEKYFFTLKIFIKKNKNIITKQ